MPASRVLYARMLDALTYLVASSAFFQELTGTVSEATALAFVHWPVAMDDGTAPRPRAIVEPLPKYELEDNGCAAWFDGGSALLTFEFDPSSTYATKPTDTTAKFKGRIQELLDRVFTILDEMKTNSRRDRPLPATTTYLQVRKFTLLELGELVQEDESGDIIMAATFQVDW